MERHRCSGFDGSYLCCALCSMAVAPSFPIAWTLDFNSQIVASSFLMSITTMCKKKIATSFLVSVEITWGNSAALQNLETILGSSILIPKSDLVCRVAILVLFALPLALSASYQTCSGGSVMNTVANRSIVEYGAFRWPLVEGSQQSYSLIDTMSAFKQASLTHPSPPTSRFFSERKMLSCSIFPTQPYWKRCKASWGSARA